MTTPYELERDIQHVLRTGEGWTDEIAEWVSSDIAKSLNRQLSGSGGARPRNLRLSSLGTKCERKLWYSINWNNEPEPLSPFTRSKFIYGDITESYVLGLCMAAGHSVSGMQDELVVEGIKGHRDCVIDGMLFDVKSCASNSFRNFTRKSIRDNDSYGYVSQISSYLYASRDDRTVTYKDKAGFLFFDKQFGDIKVRILDVSKELEEKKEEVIRKKTVVKRNQPPKKKYEADFGKVGTSKNPVIPNNPCGYCEYKMECWDHKLHVYERMDDGYRLYFTEVNQVPNPEYWRKVT